MAQLSTNPLSAPLSRLHRLLINAFDLDEFRTLCLDLNIRYDDLAGETLSAKARELLLQLERARRIASFIDLVEARRPQVDWRTGPPPDAVCPYKGLHAFHEEDADHFFGRRSFTGLLQKAVDKQPLVAVIGPSGSGKSSVVFAGLIPDLRQNGNWQIADFRPGVDPFTSLAQALLPMLEPNVSQIDRPPKTRQLATYLQDGRATLSDYLQMIQQDQPAAKILLFCDQFEELYTQVKDISQRRKFLDTLLEGFCHPGKAYDATLVITLRADFLGQVLAYPEMVTALQDRDIKIGLMSPEELEAAIVQPAANAGVGFADGLVTRILEDVGDHAGNLPLLEFALTLLWDRQSNGKMTHAAYEEIGGVSGALARHADDTLAKLTREDPALEEAIQRVMVQLVQPGAGAEDTRRIARRSDLGEADWAIVPQLADARLLITNLADQASADSTAAAQPPTTETVEVIHEALIQHWGRLQDWMERDREFRMWQERLRADLKLWQENEQQEGFLLQSAPLTVAADWLKRRQVDLSGGEINFIQASLQKRQEREKAEDARRQHELDQAKQLAEEQRKGRTRLRQIVGVLATGLLIAIVLTILLINSNQEARENEAAAQTSAAEEVAARSTSDANAMLLQTREAEALESAAVAATAQANEEARAEEAEVALNLANARYLVNQGQALFEEDPLLSLAMVVEGLNLASQQEQEKQVIADSHKEVFRWGRTAVFGAGIESLTLSPAESMLLLTYDNESSTLIDWNGETRLHFTNAIERWDINLQETWFLVDYLNPNFPDELHNLNNGSVIPLEQELNYGRFAVDSSWLLLDYYDFTNNRRTLDLYDLREENPTLQTFEVDGWDLNTDESWLGMWSQDEVAMNRFINLTNGQTIVLDGFIENWQFDFKGDWLLVDYLAPDRPDALYHLSSGEITQFAAEIEYGEFNFEGTWLLVNYSDPAIPNELRQLDGRRVIPLAGLVESWGISGEENWLLVDYLDVPGEAVQDELHNLNDGTLIRLANEVETWSLNLDETWILIDYQDAGIPDELRDLSAAEENIYPLPGETDRWEFSPDSDAVIIRYLNSDSSGEYIDLRGNQSISLTGAIERWEFSLDGRWIIVDNAAALGSLLHDNTLIPLSAEVETWIFGPQADWLLIDFVNTLGTIVDTASGRFVTVSGEIDQWGFSPTQSWLLIDYLHEPGELFDTTTGSITGSFLPLADQVGWWEFDSNETLLMVNYTVEFGNSKLLGEIRDLTTGQRIAPFANEVIWWDLPKEKEWLVVQTSKYISEIWQANEGYLLTTLGGNLKDIKFFSESKNVVVQYYDGRVYLLDLQWLEAMHNAGVLDPETELDAGGIQTLIGLACRYPLKDGSALEQPEVQQALHAYMQDIGLTEPNACKP